MSLKVGINGFGRIGKLVFRIIEEQPEIEVVHINDKMNTQLMAHLLKYDSLHGKFNAEVTFDSDHIYVNNREILVTNLSFPSEIPWNKSNVELVVESSGRFKTYPLLEGHLHNGVKKVILSCPPDDNSIQRTVVMGVNHQTIQPTDIIISNASCTTNCVALMLKVIHEVFGFKKGFMNTVHPTTNNQNLQDGYHSDFRRARSAISNIIPTTSSAVKTTQLVMPEMRGIFDGFATRVPIPDCSFVELTAELKSSASVGKINEAFLHYAKNELKNYLEYTEDPIVSSDMTNNPHSAVHDALATRVLGGDLIQILGWYDNEFAYSTRIIDLIKYIS